MTSRFTSCRLSISAVGYSQHNFFKIKIIMCYAKWYRFLVEIYRRFGGVALSPYSRTADQKKPSFLRIIRTKRQLPAASILQGPNWNLAVFLQQSLQKVWKNIVNKVKAASFPFLTLPSYPTQYRFKHRLIITSISWSSKYTNSVTFPCQSLCRI